jgi:hypothetical protein
MALVKVRIQKSEDGKIIKEDKIFWCHACKNRHKVSIKWRLTGSLLRPTITPDYLGRTTIGVGRADSEIEGKICHCKITDGNIYYCEDSEHDFKGQTIPMVDLDFIDEQEIKNAKQFATLDSKSLYGRFFGPKRDTALLNASDLKRGDRDA